MKVCIISWVDHHKKRKLKRQTPLRSLVGWTDGKLERIGYVKEVFRSFE